MVVELLAELAPPAALPTLALLERRCRPPTLARLASLARLRAPPFSVGGGVILGREGGRLSFPGRGIGDAGLTTFASALGCGALLQLTFLDLAGNQIGNDGMTALATALGSGALPALENLIVVDGPLGTEHPALKAACEARGISVYWDTQYWDTQLY